mmetsp:Transcript_43105/g.31486  ORF Transcript_43105/g.31486 Transcript_43105/m.31486 type:complete len:104 (+) Transcript_43105:349-660(+)
MVLSFNESLVYEGVLNVTNALGQMSPMSRKCDLTVADLANSFNASIDNFQNFRAFYYMLKHNIVRNHTEIDYHSYDLYLSTKEFAWGDIFFDASRLIYLLFLQ